MPRKPITPRKRKPAERAGKSVKRPVGRTVGQVGAATFISQGVVLIWPNIDPALALWIGSALTMIASFVQNTIESQVGKDLY